MKNGIITLLGLACLILVLYVLGAFDYGPAIDNDTYGRQSTARREQVASSPEWVVGVIAIPSDPMAVEVLKGAEFAAETINKDGGICGKPLRLAVKEVNRNTSVAHKMAVQELCDRDNVAMILGGLNTEDIPSLRSITQFQAMPLVSPIAVFPGNLPSLVPDTAMTFYPDLAKWTAALAAKLKQDGRRKIVLVSPDDGSYGGIFGVEASRGLHADDFFESIYTINYIPPAESSALYRSLKIMAENRDLDAIVFTSTTSDLNELGQALDQLGIKAPVYGTDYLNVDGLHGLLRDLHASLFYPVVRNAAVAGKDVIDRWTARFGSPPAIWNQLGAEPLFSFQNALEESQGSYVPAEVIRLMKKYLENQQASDQYKLDIEYVEYKRPD